MATYTYPLTHPTTPAFNQSRFELVRMTGITESPFTGATQTFSYSQYAKWRATISLPPMRREKAAQWQAFFLQLQGRLGTFYLSDPDAKTIRGAAAGTILTDGAVAVGDKSISTDGYSNGDGEVVFKAGDYVQIGTTLAQVVQDATCTSGAATLEIEPPIKSAVADDTAIVISSPVGIFRLDNDIVGWDANEVSTYGISFSCTEAY